MKEKARVIYRQKTIWIILDFLSEAMEVRRKWRIFQELKEMSVPCYTNNPKFYIQWNILQDSSKNQMKKNLEKLLPTYPAHRILIVQLQVFSLASHLSKIYLNGKEFLPCLVKRHRNYKYFMHHYKIDCIHWHLNE